MCACQIRMKCTVSMTSRQFGWLPVFHKVEDDGMAGWCLNESRYHSIRITAHQLRVALLAVINLFLNITDEGQT